MVSGQDGVLRIHRETLGGAYEAHTGYKEFTAGLNDLKRKMEIEGAIEELEKRKLIYPKKADKTVYVITPKGFKFTETSTQKTAVSENIT
jgi:predicted transcriptional regulator